MNKTRLRNRLCLANPSSKFLCHNNPLVESRKEKEKVLREKDVTEPDITAHIVNDKK